MKNPVHVRFRTMLAAIMLLGLVPAVLHAAGTIRIAAVFAKTGEAAYGFAVLPEFLAARMATDELNAQGGVLGRKIELIEIDNQSTGIGSRQAAEKAVETGAIAVIGATCSSHSLAMAPVLQAAGIPMITPVSTNVKVTLAGDCIFRACFIDPSQAKAMATFASSDLKAKTAVILTDTGTDYSLGLSREFANHFSRLGGRVLWTGDYAASATDFTPLLERVRELEPDAVFIPGDSRSAGFIMKQASLLGIRTTFLGGDGWTDDLYTYGGHTVEGNFYTTHWHQKDPSGLNQSFVREYERRYKSAPFASAALTYDAFMVLVNAIRRAQSLDRASLCSALAATKGFRGVTGDITFDADRNPVAKPTVIMRLEKGGSVYVKTMAGGQDSP